MNIDHLHRAELLKDGTRSLSGRQVSQAPAQSDMKTVGHKGDEDVCLNAMGKLMKNGANPYISLKIFEGFLDFRELGVIFPKRGWGLLSKVAPQQVLALAPVGFAKLGPVNSEIKVKFSFRLFRVWPFRFRLSRFRPARMGNFKSINPKARPASFFASPILISNALVLSFIFCNSQSRFQSFLRRRLRIARSLLTRSWL